MGALRLFLLLVLCRYAVHASSCPSKCTCTTDYRYRVDCSNQGLSSIPELPTITEELDLSGNSIESLENGAFNTLVELTELNLSNNLISTIAIDTFQNLNGLRTLNLSRNKLQADNFRDHELLRGCRRITELDISFNKLAKIPDSGLKVLTKLERLFLSNNKLRSPVFGPGFQSLEVLELVDLGHNSFDEIPAIAFNVLGDKVQTINLASCSIRTVQAGAFERLERLAHFDMSNNPGISQRDLNETIKTICTSMFLSSVRLSNVNISDLRYVLTPLLDTDDMRYLDLSHNELRRLNASDLRPATKLREINLSHNKLTALPSLGLHLLERIDLSNNRISDISNTPFDGSSDLQEVNLSHNNLDEFPSNLFSANTKLKKLDLSYNVIRNVPPIEEMEEMEELHLQGNRITEPSYFFMMLNLKTLDLGSNLITTFNKDIISFSLKLTTLNLTRNRLNYIERDSFKEWCPPILDLSHNQIEQLDGWGLALVKELYLQGNRIEQIKAEDIESLVFLEVLDLSTNQISSLPVSLLIELDDLAVLNIANNNLAAFFQGSEAKQLLSHKTTLESLNLAHNNIEVIQPRLFSNLSRLRHLDLSYNRLYDMSGEQLQDLFVLKTLNLSNNRLNGFNHSIVLPLVSLETLDLTGTQWQCDCSIAEVKAWMESTDVNIASYDSYRCGRPKDNVNKLLKDYTVDEEAECSANVMESAVILIIIGCTSFVILIVAGIIFWQHRWRLKKKLKKQHYRAMYERAQMPLPNNNDAAIGQTEYHTHQNLHQNHTSSMSQKGLCPEHNPSVQAFV
ncbi:insulin-like growth factor-binding protein complex acid labile subunit [Watersipora subatra]|uniref:insulin-like growth factor-binding protein complex acid labile subunit n=1 Tax=Watersipora subatra TaxID=2589382 RepID=UPI00355BE484